MKDDKDSDGERMDQEIMNERNTNKLSTASDHGQECGSRTGEMAQD